MFTSRWISADEPDRERVQVSGPGRGLFYAVTSARRSAAITAGLVPDEPELPGALRQSLTDRSGAVLFEQSGGVIAVDLVPHCPRCTGAYCRDASGHYSDDWFYPALAAAAVPAPKCSVCRWDPALPDSTMCAACEAEDGEAEAIMHEQNRAYQS